MGIGSREKDKISILTPAIEEGMVSRNSKSMISNGKRWIVWR